MSLLCSRNRKKDQDQGWIRARSGKKSEMGLNYVGLIYHDEELNLHVTA